MNSINLSSSFLYRARCKKCGKTVETAFSTRSRLSLISNNIDNKYFRWYSCNKTIIDYLRHESFYFLSFRYFVNTDTCCFIPCKSFSSSFVRKLGIQDIEYIDIATCSCGNTRWIFYYFSAQNKPEIINRKCRLFGKVKILI